MTPISSNAAYIIKKINDICGEPPCKKALQKMIFLIEKKGIQLGYDYGLHFYGPYSSRLDDETTDLSSDGVVKFDYSGYSHLMSVDEKHFSVDPKGLTEQQINEIDNIIERFKGKSASELELLTTAIYAYDHLDHRSVESVIKGVQKIKGAKYSVGNIKGSLENFTYFNRQFAE